jgi:hypothetical protein
VKLPILSLANAPSNVISLSLFSLTGFIPLGILRLAFSLTDLRLSVLLSDSVDEYRARPHRPHQDSSGRRPTMPIKGVLHQHPRARHAWHCQLGSTSRFITCVLWLGLKISLQLNA